MNERPPLFPVPRHVAWGDRPVSTSREPVVRHDRSLPAQGYDLRCDDAGITIRHADEAGRRYGEQTLTQLRVAGELVPTVHVRDWPDLAARGVMLDVSRDRVPTRASLERLVSLLAIARYNHLQLYIEHTFAYPGQEAVWSGASPLTADDLRWLDERCAAAGIELAANQNCFGHFGRWLARPEYRERAECPDGLTLSSGIRLDPGVLEPTEENARFALGLVRQQLAVLRSRWVNIGCDETFELGRGRSAVRVGADGVTDVYLEQLHRLVRPLQDEGCSVQVWGDVVERDPAQLGALPDGDVTWLVWNYDAPDAPTPVLSPRVTGIFDELGIDLSGPTDFASRIAPFVAAGAPFWVAPGTSSWNSLVGRLDNARANLLDAAVEATSAGAEGYLVTDWGDNGHHQPPSVSDAPLLYGGGVSWCASANADVDLAAVVDRYSVQDPSGTVGRVLETIGSVGSRTGVTARNLSPLFAALFPHIPVATSGRPDAAAVAEIIEDLDQARDELATATPRAVDGATVIEELDVAIGLARHGAVRMGDRAGLTTPPPEALHAELAELADRYREVWAARSRPGGLDDSVGHIEQTLRSYEAD